MKNYKLHVSEGFKDTYGEEMLIKKEIEHKVLETFKSHGYEHIKTPALEYIDVYALDGTQKPDLYNLINRQGEVLSLCNDMTASIARFVCSNNSLAIGAKKYCYVADTFRYPRLYQGKNHQFLQAGVEFLGEEGIESDISVLYLAYKTLVECKIKNFTIHLGSSAFLDALCIDYNIPFEKQKKIKELITLKDYVTLRNVLEETLDEEDANLFIDLMLKGGKLHFMDELLAKIKSDKAKAVLLYLKEVYTTLEELGVEGLIFDFSIYSYAEYYTGIIFSVYVEGIGKSVLTGGRSDTLFASYGKNMADCGFGMDLDSITQYALEHKLIDVVKMKYLSISDKESYTYSLKANELLREKGYIVSEIEIKTIEEAIEYAKENGFNFILEYKNKKSKLMEVKKC